MMSGMCEGEQDEELNTSEINVMAPDVCPWKIKRSGIY